MKKYYKIEDYAGDLTPAMQQIFYTVRELIVSSDPEVKESIKYNLPFYTCKGLLFYLGMYKKKNLVLAFCNGVNLPDPHNRLQADSGQSYLRHWVLNYMKEPDYIVLANYIHEAIRINKMGN